MKRIGLISDTHGFLDEKIFGHLESCDEIWHAGDLGAGDILDKLAAFRPVKAVFGNIDDQPTRLLLPETLLWNCEDVKVMMTHIGGYPGRYAAGIRKELLEKKPALFICGHSHILKIIYDPALQCLHMNPGAAGKQGWHRMRTIVRFSIEGKDIKDCQVIELGAR
ncbi:MAG: metallophosphoesterase family protein [Chitinophagaceae bacterium]